MLFSVDIIILMAVVYGIIIAIVSCTISITLQYC